MVNKQYKMTEELYNLCMPYEDNLRTALKANYSRYISRNDGEIIRDRIYNPLFNTQDKRNVGCGKCMLSILQRIAPYYFEYKENKEKINTTVNNVEVEGYTGRTNQEAEKGDDGNTEAKPAKRASVSKTKAKAQSNKAGSGRQSKKG